MQMQAANFKATYRHQMLFRNIQTSVKHKKLYWRWGCACGHCTALKLLKRSCAYRISIAMPKLQIQSETLQTSNSLQAVNSTRSVWVPRMSIHCTTSLGLESEWSLKLLVPWIGQLTSALADQLLPHVMQSSGLPAASFLHTCWIFLLAVSYVSWIFLMLFHMSVLVPVMVSADHSHI